MKDGIGELVSCCTILKKKTCNVISGGLAQVANKSHLCGSEYCSIISHIWYDV